MELLLQLKGEHFDRIAKGMKRKEYRLITPYWSSRLVGQTFSRIILTRGYPTKGDMTRTLVRPWRGFRRTWIKRAHYGPDKVAVYAITVN